MAWPLIVKGSFKCPPNLADYDRARADFRWDAAAGLSASGNLNIAVEATDRHVAAGRGDAVALRCIGRIGVTDVTYHALAERTDRFASLLRSLEVGPGAVVATLLERGLDLHTAALGAMKAGAVFCPLFTALGPEPVRARLALGGAAVLVTTAERYRHTVAPLRHLLPALRHVLIVDGAAEGGTDLGAALAACGRDYEVAATAAEHPALLHFTSGTAGAPKGALHGHGTAVGIAATARLVLDLRAEDVFWCTAAAGWVTGTIYGLIAPLLIGATSIIDTEDFDASHWYSVLSSHRVTVFYTTPTAIHMLMRCGAALARTFRFPCLRVAASVGEPLNPEAVVWGREALGAPFHDTWWQTETGAITIANFPAMPIKPGSMGRPVPGVEAAVVRRLGAAVMPVNDPKETGEIAIRRPLPSMFSGYIGDAERTAASFVGDWYMTGDFARRDADGYFWFVGRGDDVIKSSGHMIGPFEIEAVLMDHPAVAEAGVIGRPDPMSHERIAAYITLNPGFEAGEGLRRELLAFARDQLGQALAPKEIQFVRELPKTNNGKILRRILRQHDLGVIEAELPSQVVNA